MPKSPCCNITCGMYESGFVCPKCSTLYTYQEGKSFEDYDDYEVINTQLLFMQFLAQDLLRQGANRVRFTNDAIIIEHFNETF